MGMGRVGEVEGCWHQKSRGGRLTGGLAFAVVPPPPPLPVSAVDGTSSAALNVLFDHHAAVSEERTGERLQQSPGVGAGVKGLHVAQGRTLTADYASRGVDLPVQDSGAAQRHGLGARQRFTTFTVDKGTTLHNEAESRRGKPSANVLTRFSSI